jgi:hypothetical protein
MEKIYRQERQRWLREEAPRKSIREGIAESVPYWIILVALVLFGLSAPHTAGVFDKLTPGWGWLAPIGVEFGLLYTAFRRWLKTYQPKAVLVWAYRPENLPDFANIMDQYHYHLIETPDAQHQAYVLGS